MQRSRSRAALLAAALLATGLLAAACAQAARTESGSAHRLAAGCVTLMMPGDCLGVFTPSSTPSSTPDRAVYDLACESFEVKVLCGQYVGIEDDVSTVGLKVTSERQDGAYRRKLFEWYEPEYEGPGHHGIAVQYAPDAGINASGALVKIRYKTDVALEIEARQIADSVTLRDARS